VSIERNYLQHSPQPDLCWVFHPFNWYCYRYTQHLHGHLKLAYGRRVTNIQFGKIWRQQTTPSYYMGYSLRLVSLLLRKNFFGKSLAPVLTKSATFVWALHWPEHGCLLSFSDILNFTCAFQFCTLYKLVVSAACQLRDTDTGWQKNHKLSHNSLRFQKWGATGMSHSAVIIITIINTSSLISLVRHSNTNVITN